jgi:hypothetical protein
MSAFDLRSSPFFLLDVSPRDNRSAIAAAVEGAVADGKLEETAAIRAQQVLMSPRLRLDAELAWLPGVAPNRARQLIEHSDLDIETASSLPLLAGANVAGHRCAAGLIPTHHELMLRFYKEGMPDEVLNLLNSERRASGFPAISPDLFNESLQDLLQQHTLALTHFIVNEPRPGDALLNLLGKNFCDQGKIVELLDALVEQHDSHAAATLGTAETAITTCLDVIQSNPASLDQHLPVFSDAISEWASAAAPRQYILARRHVKDPRTELLLDRIRSVCLHLHSELDDARTPLALTKAALPAFEESPEHFDIVHADAGTLEEHVSAQEAFELVEPLQKLITELNNKHRVLCKSVSRGHFRKEGRGVAGDMYRLFEKSAHDLAGTPTSGAPFRMVLSLAIDLHNQSQASDEALLLVNALRDYEDLPKPDDVVEALKKNGLIIYQSILQKNLTAAIQGRRFRKSARLAQDLATSTTDKGHRAEWEKLSTDLGRRSVKQFVSYGGFAAVFVGIIALASIGDHLKGPTYSSASTRTAPSSTYAPPDQTSVSAPRKGSGVLTGPELRWCLLEVDRLRRIRQMAGDAPSDAVVDAWNGRHDDWSSRCAHKEYYQSDYAVANSLVQSSAMSLQVEAASIYASWTRPEATAPTSPAELSGPNHNNLVPGKTK